MSQTVNSRVIVPSSLSSARRGRTHHTPAGEPAALFHIINSVTIIGFVGADPEQRQARNKNGGKFTRNISHLGAGRRHARGVEENPPPKGVENREASPPPYTPPAPPTTPTHHHTTLPPPHLTPPPPH